MDSTLFRDFLQKARIVAAHTGAMAASIAVDTITTRFLLLFLFLLAIPLITVIIFTVSLLANHMDESGDQQLMLSRNLFDAAIGNTKEKLALQNAFQQQITSATKPITLCQKAHVQACILVNQRQHTITLLPGTKIPLATQQDNNPAFRDAGMPNIAPHPFVARLQNQMFLLRKSTLPATANTNLFLGATLDNAFLNAIYRQQPGLQTEIWILGNPPNATSPPELLASSVPTAYPISRRDLLNALQRMHPQPQQLSTIQLGKSAARILPTTLYSSSNEPIGQVLHILPLMQNQRLLSNYYMGIYIIAVASLIFSVLLAMLAGRPITQPLLKLIRQVNTISRDTVTRNQHEVPVAGVHEIRQLGEAFNRMITRLQQQQKMKDEFVATLTHDLKVPLLAEKQTLAYFRKQSYGPLSPEQTEVLEILQSSNQSCLSLVNGLLEVYRYESGEVALLLESFNLTTLMQETLAELQSLSLEKSITLTMHNDLAEQPEFSLVFADRLEIKRVLHNLISNAIINTPIHGQIQCRITDAAHYGSSTVYKVSSLQATTLKHPLNLENRLLVLVQDSGIGFSNDDLPSLFKQFAGSRGRNPMSIGLGLYNCFQVLQAHNGFLWVESTEGEGALVGFILSHNQQAAQDRRVFHDRRRQR